MFKEKKDINHWFIIPELYIDKSDKHGVGVFTTEDLPKGKIIEVSPVVLCHTDTFFEKLNDWEPGEPRHVLADYVFGWTENIQAFPLGWAGIYNHDQFNSNVCWKNSYELPGIAFITKRKILEGEELCTQYIPPHLSEWLWFDDQTNDKNTAIERYDAEFYQKNTHLRSHELPDNSSQRPKNNNSPTKGFTKRVKNLVKGRPAKENRGETLKELWTKREGPNIIKTTKKKTNDKD